jgi:tartrate dehydrogenase/decarboxylase/D-malate dehydrogenase
MMLEHLGYPEAARAVDIAVDQVLADEKLRTPDLGGKASTKAIGMDVAAGVALTVERNCIFI